MTKIEINRLAKKLNEVFGCPCDYEDMGKEMIDYCCEEYDDDDGCCGVSDEKCWKRFIRKAVSEE